MSKLTCMIWGTIIGVVITLLLYILVMPKKNDGNSPKWKQALYDLFHFKKLYLEGVLRLLYTLSTVCCISTGIMLFFGKSAGIFMLGGEKSTFVSGILTIIVGPILIRLLFELFMLLLVLINNVVEINQKLGGNGTIQFSNNEEATQKFSDFVIGASGKVVNQLKAYKEYADSTMNTVRSDDFTQTPTDVNTDSNIKICPSCGERVVDGKFCPKCGQSL